MYVTIYVRKDCVNFYSFIFNPRIYYIYTHTHTHTYICILTHIYIYIEREREKESEREKRRGSGERAHWVSHSYGLVLHLSKPLSKILQLTKLAYSVRSELQVHLSLSLYIYIYIYKQWMRKMICEKKSNRIRTMDKTKCSYADQQISIKP